MDMYSRKTLGEACGLSLASITRHLKANTYGIQGARLPKEPGVGVRFSWAKAQRFVKAMQAKHGRKEAA